MKKFFSVLAIMLVLVMSFSMTTFAAALHVDPNPNTTVPFSTPEVDGNIDAVGEGYSAIVDLSDVTCGHYWAHNPMSTQANLYYAFDNEGLYVAAVVTEGLEAIDERDGTDLTGLNQFNYSTGFDELDLTEEGLNEFGWNGDVMGIMIDPFGGFLSEGFSGGADHSAWYMVGLFEGNVARVYKSHTSTDGEITDKVKAAGKQTAAGWDFEVMIPWDMIVADTDDCSMGFVAIDKETLVKEGTYLRVGAMYHDRFFDTEQGGLGTWGRYIVVPETLADGSPGPGGVGDNIASYGIELTLGAISDNSNDDNGTNGGGTNGGNTNGGDSTDTNGNTNGGTNGSGNGGTNGSTNGNTNGGTTSGGKNNTTNNSGKKPTTGSATGSNAAQTSDMGLILAVATLATSGAGIAIAKKRR